MTKTRLLAALILIAVSGNAIAEDNIIRRKATDFTSTTMGQKQLEKIKKTKRLVGGGEADYEFVVSKTGWYELWVYASGWDTSLYLDGKFLIHTVFNNEVWKPRGPRGETKKTMNLYIEKGKHRLKFSRRWHPGLPWMKSFSLEPAKDITGMVRVVPQKDYMTFRKGEAFPVSLTAGKQAEQCTLKLVLKNPKDGSTLRTIDVPVPAGSGPFKKTVKIPTDHEGVWDLHITDSQGRGVDRTMQFLVVDTKTPLVAAEKLEKQLVQEIDCAKIKPNYEYGGTKVIDAAIGSYRQSGNSGAMQAGENPDSFAYTLTLPSIGEFYLIEADYPDDDLRFFTIYVVDPNGFGFPPSPGVASGGPYPLSGKMQTRQIFFIPRHKNPRVIFTPWQTDMPAAVSRIRVYRVGHKLPVFSGKKAQRGFGLFTEEAYRLPHFFGAMPTGNDFLTLAPPTEKKARWTTFVGASRWNQTIGIYANILWPSKILINHVPGAGSYGFAGPWTTKDPMKKDLIRMMLLNCEKSKIGFVGDLHLSRLPMYRDVIASAVKANPEKYKTEKPWLIVSKDGNMGERSSRLPYYNPVCPAVQDFVGSIFREISQRYKDSPAFEGLRIRLGGWAFASWQTFPSIHWGYGDYTISLFEKETGIHIPVANDAPDRFLKRYDWLMANAYDKWVNWRCRKTCRNWKRLHEIMKAARPDLKLYISTSYNNDTKRIPSHSRYDVLESISTATLMKETGVDPALYRNEPGIILRWFKPYPAGFTGIRNMDFYRLFAAMDYALGVPGKGAKDRDNGTVCFGGLGQASYERYPLFKDYGMEGSKQYRYRGKGRFPVSGSISPAGRNYLEIYALQMANGNMVDCVDFQRGVLMDQYELKREFMAEYRNLPAIGMNQLKGADDPVAVWYGMKDGKTYFYLVNRAYYPVKATLEFAGKAQISRLSTGRNVALDKRNAMTISLAPFQLRSYIGSGQGKPSALTVNVGWKIKKQLAEQLAFAGKIFDAKNGTKAVLPISPVDIEKAKKKLAEARAAYKEGRYVATRRLISHRYLVKVYNAFKAWPAGLWQTKLVSLPKAALCPKDIKTKGTADRKVMDAGKIDSSLSGKEVLVWNGKLKFDVGIPLLNNYRLSYGYMSKSPYGTPILMIDGKNVPGQEGLSSDNGIRSVKTIAELMPLAQGKHQVEFSLPANLKGGLLFFSLQPVYQYLSANQWSVVGPFPSKPIWRKPGAGMNTAYPPEEKVDFTGSYNGFDGEKIRWQIAKCDGDYVNLHKTTGAYDKCVSYAVCGIESPDERNATINFGVDYWAKIWVNGEKVFEITESHSEPERDQFKIPVKLKKGKNEIKIKVHSGSAGNGFWMAISDPGDLKVTVPAIKN